MTTFAEKYGPWAFIAGGSEGIGKSFALQLAERGLNLILVARNGKALDDTAAEIRARYPVQVATALLNLTGDDLAEKLDAVITGMTFGAATETQSSSGAPTPNLVPMQPDDVAREALEHLGKGPVWIAGARNREAAAGLKTAARDQVVQAMSAATAQLYGLSTSP